MTEVIIEISFIAFSFLLAPGIGNYLLEKAMEFK
jgi:hypothetical protein